MRGLYYCRRKDPLTKIELTLIVSSTCFVVVLLVSKELFSVISLSRVWLLHNVITSIGFYHCNSGSWFDPCPPTANHRWPRPRGGQGGPFLARRPPCAELTGLAEAWDDERVEPACRGVATRGELPHDEEDLVTLVEARICQEEVRCRRREARGGAVQELHPNGRRAPPQGC
jgi:hypothetical protein